MIRLRALCAELRDWLDGLPAGLETRVGQRGESMSAGERQLVAAVAVGLDGNHANSAMHQTPDGNGRIELFEYIHPEAIMSGPTVPNEIGMHRLAFSANDIDEALDVAARHGCHPLRGVANYNDIYKLTYVRGPSGNNVMLAEELGKADR